MTQITKNKPMIRAYPLLTPREKLLILESIKGMWKNRKPDPIKEWRKMRKSWDRKII